MGAITRCTASAMAVATAAHVTPSVLTLPFLRDRLLAGRFDCDAVALTFDDGPNPGSTPHYLDALARIGVRATFFLLGSKLQRHPGLGRRIVGEGHEVAVHGWTHEPHLLRTPWDVALDIKRAYDAVCETVDRRPQYWRPPHGIVTGTGLCAATALGMKPMLWTADGEDWLATSTPESITGRIMGALHRGGVVLLHDSHDHVATDTSDSALAAVPMLVTACRDRGLEPRRLCDLSACR